MVISTAVISTAGVHRGSERECRQTASRREL